MSEGGCNFAKRKLTRVLSQLSLVPMRHKISEPNLESLAEPLHVCTQVPYLPEAHTNANAVYRHSRPPPTWNGRIGSLVLRLHCRGCIVPPPSATSRRLPAIRKSKEASKTPHAMENKHHRGLAVYVSTT